MFVSNFCPDVGYYDKRTLCWRHPYLSACFLRNLPSRYLIRDTRAKSKFSICVHSENIPSSRPVCRRNAVTSSECRCIWVNQINKLGPICTRSSIYIHSLCMHSMRWIFQCQFLLKQTTVNAKMQHSKNLRHWFGNYKTIKNSKNTEKLPNVNKTLIQNECAFTIVQCTSKGVSAFHVVYSQT